MTAVISTNCSECRKPLTDPLSRRYGIGPCCRKGMTPEQLADALRRNQPGYIPRARPASATARRNHAEIARVTENEPAVKLCEHDDRPAACPLCRRDNDPWRCAERVIALRQRMPRGERLEAERAAAHRILRGYAPAVGNPRKTFQPAPTPASTPADDGALFEVAS